MTERIFMCVAYGIVSVLFVFAGLMQLLHMDVIFFYGEEVRWFERRQGGSL